MTTFCKNLEQWMTFLPLQVRDEVPIINLAIPGSHDSMSYGIEKNAKIAPDAEPIVDRLYKYIPCVVRRWAKTQKYTITEQLDSGIRYFDLRISTKPNDSTHLYFVHGLFCEEITEPLKEMLEFLLKNPSEFVILDFQHFYDFEKIHHEKLIQLFMQSFEDLLYGRNAAGANLSQLTLNGARVLNKQMLVIYRNNQNIPPQFYPSNEYPTPWPNSTSVRELQEYLDKRLMLRKPETGFISQCVLTPDVKYIIPRFYSTLRQTCAKKVNKKMLGWIKEQQPGKFVKGEKPTSNVFLADFIDIRDSNFSKIVIDLNMKIVFKEKGTFKSN